MTVLDASFIVKLVIEEDSSSKARKLSGKWAESGIRLATLDIAFVEAVNAIWKHVVKVGDLNEGDALNGLRDIKKWQAS
jgi:predicted nucleic acid-binding protein